MHGGGWVQNFDILHLLPAFNAWDSGLYFAKLCVHCAYRSLSAEARADYQTG